MMRLADGPRTLAISPSYALQTSDSKLGWAATANALPVHLFV